MFAAIYQCRIKPGRELEYRRLWHQIASYFISHKGAIGSCLHRAENGVWIAYSRWPSKEARDAAWPGENDPSEKLPIEIQQAIAAIKNCADPERKVVEICMEVVEDLL